MLLPVASHVVLVVRTANVWDLPKHTIAPSGLRQDRAQCRTAEGRSMLSMHSDPVAFREDRQHALLVLVLVGALRHHGCMAA